MRVITYPTASGFLDAVRPVLSPREAEHHMVLGVAEAFAAATLPETGLFAATVEDDAGVALSAWMEGSRPLLLAGDRPDAGPAAMALVEALGMVLDGDRGGGGFGRSLRRAIGAIGQVEPFADAWIARTGRPARVAMRQRVYRLDAVEALPAVSGSMRVATSNDLDLVAEWMVAFEREALGPLSTPIARSVAEQRVTGGQVYLWCDGEPRAMAGSARPTARAIAVNAVYTPPEWRGRGYATACVAELSRRLLASGFEFCVLYTDLENPTSNAIYARIGYRPVRDFLMYDFRPDAVGA